MALCLAQLATFRYSPERQIPTQANREAGRRLVERLRAIDGDVWALAHGYLAWMAGKPPFAHLMPMFDVQTSAPDVGAQLEAQYRGAVVERRFAAVLETAGGDLKDLRDELAVGYDPAAPILANPKAFSPRAGACVRPGTLWIRREAPP